MSRLSGSAPAKITNPGAGSGLGDGAWRVLLDHLAKDANWNQIFTLIRCVRCSDKGGWKEPAS